MIAVGDVDAAPSAQLAFVPVIEELDAMQIVKIPFCRRILAVDLERVERLVAARVASSFKSSQRSIRKARENRARIVDSNRLHFAR